jgi:polysaccharide biosynthesis transport protein
MSVPVGYERARESENLANVFGMLRRRWLIIVSVVLACVVVGVLRHETTPKSYTATASVAFQTGTLSEAALQVSTSGGAEPQREAGTETLIAHSSEVAQGVRKQLHISATPTELLSEVKVEAAANANVLNIIASTKSAQYSAQLANAFAEQYKAFKTKSQLAGLSAAEEELKHQLVVLPEGSAERATLQQSLQRLSELRAVAGNGASIIGLASAPTSPSGLGTLTTAVIGVLIGLAISFSLVFLLESLDRRIKSIDEFEGEYHLSVLAGVPQLPQGTGGARDRTELLEPYRILRSALDFAAATRTLDTLLVTSATSGEGKTTVAVDLAHAVALTGRRVALVELDLRRPTFARHFHLDPRDGITTALIHREMLDGLLMAPLVDLPNLSVLPSGRLPPNPAELLGSPGVGEIIAELASRHDLVVIDAPPLNPVADAQVLLNNSAIHAAIVVARLDRTTREEVRRARAILDRHLVEPVGVVVTGLRDPSRYGYEAYPANGPVVDLAAETPVRSSSVEALGRPMRTDVRAHSVSGAGL